jgi:phosphoglycerol transferase MdoB-like AlkP superfamily enzyme
MKVRIFFLLKYLFFWLSLFILGKILFLLYEHDQSFALPLTDWFLILLHGFRLDLSTAGYFLLLPTLVIAVTCPLKGKPAYYIINVYTFVFLIVFLLITLVDLEIYKYWGSRLDSAPLRFLSTPGDVLASSSLITLVLYFTAFGLLSFFLFWSYLRLVPKQLKEAGKGGFAGIPVFLLILASLIIPIRGGFNVSVINTGSAFFHKNTFANHAGINVIWNFGHSLVEKKEYSNPYISFRDKDYATKLKEMYHYEKLPPKILKTEKPNVILIILESFTAKLIEPLGGAHGVTPCFNSLCSHGIFFTNIYASDSRTDKGLATVLSGYPVLESIPILKYPDKTIHLPFVSKSLIEKGYKASFNYGGDVDFANIRSYLVNGDFGRIITEASFPVSERSGKWGVPDHYSFARFFNDIRPDTGKWFHVMLSLSNHEPFEIPVRQKFGNKDLFGKFYSSAYYADSCLGDFVRRLKESGMWDNTVLVLVADHGVRVPDYSEVFEPRKFHIPLLITGGAVAKDSIVSKFGSQADLAVTLLHQLNIKTDGYFLGKDLLAPDSKSFVIYSYKNGIAMLTDSSGFGYDFSIRRFSFSYGVNDSAQINLARAQQQYVFQNYLDLSAEITPELVRK